MMTPQGTTTIALVTTMTLPAMTTTPQGMTTAPVGMTMTLPETTTPARP